MIDSLTNKIKRYPFQTGIVVGCILALLLVLFMNLFQDNGRTLSGNAEIIQQDYLRMAINEYGSGGDAQLAGWRYAHLGSKADETLRLMKADESIPARLLTSFADAVGKLNVLTENSSGTGVSRTAGTPTTPRKGLSGFGIALLVLLILALLCVGGLYVASLVKTKKKQKERAEIARKVREEPVTMVSPERRTEKTEPVKDTLFDLDDLFPKEEPKEEKLTSKKASASPTEEKSGPEKFERFESFSRMLVEDVEEESAPVIPAHEEPKPVAEEEEKPVGKTAAPAAEKPAVYDISGLSEPETEEEEEESLPVEETEEVIQDEKKEGLAIETETFEIHDHIIEDESAEKPEPDKEESWQEAEPSPDEVLQEPEDAGEPFEEKLSFEIPEERDEPPSAEKPLVETDTETDPDSDDELLKIIRGVLPESDSAVSDEKNPFAPEEAPLPEPEKDPDPELPFSELVPVPVADDETEEEEILIHYQSTYKIGNDNYDEVFSIDQGENFRGECGIGIAETLNNTEPKAVTAFELWLFDKDDIHTHTRYLLSDFALSNEGISSRLGQHGSLDRIRKGNTYLLETATLTVEVKVLEMEYGSEMDEKFSYFTNVTFDVTARGKKQENDQD